MTDEELELKNLISDCGHTFCPLYFAFWNKPNAQEQFRRDHFKWSNKYKPKQFKIGEEVFGAKLALIMESPPPNYLEYFYGPQGGFEKEVGLFKNIIFTLARIENRREKLDFDKDIWLKWFAELGIVILDAAKCRMQISDAFKAEKISHSKMSRTFDSCSEILELQLKILNPFRVAVGIASVYNHSRNNIPYIQELLSELGDEKSFMNKKTVSLWDYSGPDTFLKWFEEIWSQVKVELSNYEVKYI